MPSLQRTAANKLKQIVIKKQKSERLQNEILKCISKYFSFFLSFVQNFSD